MRETFVQELVIAHILYFHNKLSQITPGPGYVIDPVTCTVMTGNISVAADQVVPQAATSLVLPSQTPLTHSTHFQSAGINTPPSQAHFAHST